MTRDIPGLPAEVAEVEGGAWPRLSRTVAKSAPYLGVKDWDEQEAIIRGNRAAAERRAWLSDFLSAAPKGALLGLILFGVVYGLGSSIRAWWVETGIVFPRTGDLSTWLAFVSGLTPQPSDWLSALPWLLVIVGGIALMALFGTGTGLVLAAVACVALSVFAIPHHMIAFGLFIGVGVIVRCLYELIP